MGLTFSVRYVASVLGLALTCLAAPGCSRTGQAPQHVVIVSLDTTRADQLGCYGNETVATPNLDELAAESIVLDDLMTPAPTTLAAHTSLFTGSYPQTHGVPRNGFLVPEANLMLAEILAEQGFTTAGFAGSFVLAGRFGIDQGFEHYDEQLSRQGGQQGRLQDERRAETVTDAVIGYLERNGTPQRLFLFVHYFDAHAPYEAPPPYDTMYDKRGRAGLPPWFEVSRQCTRRDGVMTPLDQRMAQQYAGEISYLDAHLGRLLDDLRRRGILDRALLLVTSDHGENFWEHPACFDHGWATYQTTMRAVGILRLPGGEGAGTRRSALASTVDLLPTILGRLGLEPPQGIEGRAIDLDTPVAAADDTARFGQATKPVGQFETDPRWLNMLKARCIRQGPHKLIQLPYAGREELYDLSRDPLEQHNLLEGSPTEESRSIARPLRRRLEEWAASADPLEAHFDREHRDETIRRLKSLGYLGGN